MDDKTLAISPFTKPEKEGFAVGAPDKGKRRCIVVARQGAASVIERDQRGPLSLRPSRSGNPCRSEPTAAPVVAAARQFFLLHEQRQPGGQPFLAGADFVSSLRLRYIVAHVFLSLADLASAGLSEC
jgi:hypothetical protein